MTELGNKIIKLKKEGYTYNKIMKELCCSKSTISYYLGENQKEKTRNRTKKRRENVLQHKIDTFRHSQYKKIRVSSVAFQKRDDNFVNNYNKSFEKKFNWVDILEKFSENTFCYLSGEKINLIEDTNYNLDHILPKSKGGSNEFDNLGILHETVNQMKGNLLNDELIEWCVKILKYNGYTVIK